jgi:hypothetical protein
MYLKSKSSMNAFLITLLSGLLWIMSASAQTGSPIDVRGTVKDIAGDPIIGVNVLLQGTTTGTRLSQKIDSLFFFHSIFCKKPS